MPSDVASAGLIGLLLLVFGVVLLALAIWFRRGRSAASRHWARRRSIDETVTYAVVEGIVLGLTPMLAQTLIVAGIAVPLAVILGVDSAAATVMFWVILVLEICLWSVTWVLITYRWILPLWMYPGWLRGTRRAEVEYLRAQQGLPPSR